MKDIPQGSVDMVLCDLPYGVTKNRWDTIIPPEKLWPLYWHVCKENAAIVLFGQNKFTATMMLSCPYHRYNWIWEKTHAKGFLNAKRMPLNAHEDIMVFYKKLPTYNPQKTSGHTRKVSLLSHRKNARESTNYGDYSKRQSYNSDERYPRSVLRFAADTQNSAIHPTQKPVALLEYLIKTYTNEGETVLDNTSGSASTAIACMNTGRNFICIEKDPLHFQDAQKRLNKWS